MRTFYEINSFPSRDDFLSDVVGQLIARRHELKLSQEQLDTVIGHADRLVSKWECGLRTPTGFNLYCWAEALECELTISMKKKDRQK